MQPPNYYEPISGLIIGSKQMLAIIEQIRLIATRDTTILITGETGTGKELIAKAIHLLGSRNEEPYIVVDCTTLASDLVESELFGHERGAFTGAYALKKGLFEKASHGTLFFDEIGKLSLALQSKLLRAIENKSFRRVGSTEYMTTNSRVIAATNRDLHELQVGGEFHEDLYYRLAVFPIHVPPLRDRLDDVEHISRYFLGSVDIADDAFSALTEYRWPGNIRELRNALEFATIMSQGETVRFHHLPRTVTQSV